jgi:hypothetical protein
MDLESEQREETEKHLNESRLTPVDPDMLHVSPEMAIAEADVALGPQSEFVRSTSLWQDAWRRLLKNKLAVFGLVVVILVTIFSVVGPPIIKRTSGLPQITYLPTTWAWSNRFRHLLDQMVSFRGLIRWALITPVAINLPV